MLQILWHSRFEIGRLGLQKPLQLQCHLSWSEEFWARICFVTGRRQPLLTYPSLAACLWCVGLFTFTLQVWCGLDLYYNFLSFVHFRHNYCYLVDFSVPFSKELKYRCDWLSEINRHKRSIPYLRILQFYHISLQLSKPSKQDALLHASYSFLARSPSLKNFSKPYIRSKKNPPPSSPLSLSKLPSPLRAPRLKSQSQDISGKGKNPSEASEDKRTQNSQQAADRQTAGPPRTHAQASPFSSTD